jgi:6-phosphogluconolactonase/glucosamine-6-phosphate isomerase/deaminase
MTRAVAAGRVSFRQAEIFSLDEFGGLAPDDAGLCSNMLRRFLIDAVDLPKERFHALDPNAPNVDQICREYDAAIGAGFDLTLLGIGLNGHLGLNEPGSAVDSPTRRVEMHSTTVRASAGYLTHSRLPTWGVAVGLKPLLASREIWLLANGSAKAEIIQRALKGPIDVSIPASLLRKHPNSYAFVDAAASSPFVQLSMVPLLTLTAYYAPPGHRATWFALMASLMNIAVVASQLQTKYLNDIFVVGRGQYAELGPLLIWAVALSFILPVGAIALFGKRAVRHVAVRH